jgi:hypothetical protein
MKHFEERNFTQLQRSDSQMENESAENITESTGNSIARPSAFCRDSNDCYDRQLSLRSSKDDEERKLVN